MRKIEIPAYKVSDDSMGDGWRDNSEAAAAFAKYLEQKLPGMIAEEGDEVEFSAERTGCSGVVNNPCAYVMVNDEESESMSDRVQHAREQLWESFCNEFGSTYGA